jgi:hypothetical protein
MWYWGFEIWWKLYLSKIRYLCWLNWASSFSHLKLSYQLFYFYQLVCLSFWLLIHHFLCKINQDMYLCCLHLFHDCFSLYYDTRALPKNIYASIISFLIISLAITIVNFDQKYLCFRYRRSLQLYCFLIHADWQLPKPSPMLVLGQFVHGWNLQIYIID